MTLRGVLVLVCAVVAFIGLARANFAHGAMVEELNKRLPPERPFKYSRINHFDFIDAYRRTIGKDRLWRRRRIAMAVAFAAWTAVALIGMMRWPF